MKNLIKLLPFIIGLLLFKNWFTTYQIIGGDWPFFYTEFLNELSFFPPSWASYQGNGLGGEFISYSLDTYLYLIVSLFVHLLGFSWEIVYKIFFFGFFLFFSIFSSWYLLSVVSRQLSKSILSFVICCFLYVANTYVLMMVGGGQMGTALAYSLAPLVLARFIMILDDKNLSLYNSIIAGLVLALQILFDARIAYITLIPILLYILFFIPYAHVNIHPRSAIKIFLYTFIIPLLIALSTHFFWILPSLFFQSNAAYELIRDKNSEGLFTFLSFANFSQTLSTLHPNWPENIFGKVYFMRPEFLMIPLIAMASLLFIGQKTINTKQYQFVSSIRFFVLLALIGAFLAKGANPPFGEVNVWLYRNIPGFILFRDPTKFYLLTIISYSILIPFTLHSMQACINKYISRSHKKYLHYVFACIVVAYISLLISPAIFSRLGGTFKKQTVPTEYVQLKDFLSNQRDFFRTLWIPRQQRFSYYSNLHPAVDANVLFQASNSAVILSRLQKDDSQKELSSLSIKYLIVPYDSLGEIFLQDRKYDDRQYQEIVHKIGETGNFRKIFMFGKIAVFEVNNPQKYIWVKEGVIEYNKIQPDHYSFAISNLKENKIFLSENYHDSWIMRIDGKTIHSEKTSNGLNSFLLPAGVYTRGEIIFEKSIYYFAGRIVSFIVLVSLSIVVLVTKIRKTIKN